MIIQKFKFDNYRNLSGLTVDFDKKINYIIGENGVGKSNILDAINKIFCSYSFFDSDFYDEEKPILIELTINLNDKELGIFDDLVTPEEPNNLNLIITQQIDDVYLKVKHKETGTDIAVKTLHSANVLFYDSLRNPKTELQFSKTKGAGGFLNFLLTTFLKEKDVKENNYIDEVKIQEVTDYLKDKLNKVDFINSNNIYASINLEEASFLPKIISLKDSTDVDITNTGYGIQYTLLIVLSLLEKIVAVTRTNKEKDINSILVLDEPEIHLHPYAQRALISDLLEITDGKNGNFNTLLKELFDIDSFYAQIILVSHSDRIIGGNYKNIIRVFNESGNVHAVSGLLLDAVEMREKKERIEKQLIMQMPYFCEAMFARSVIIVEGESEIAALQGFAKTMGISLDKFGISLIRSGSKESINPLIDLFSLFKIPCIGVKDKDDGVPSNDKEYILSGSLLFTNNRDFECDILDKMGEDYSSIFKLLDNLDRSVNLAVQSSSAEKNRKKYMPHLEKIEHDLQWEVIKSDKDLSRLFLICKLVTPKSIITGAEIGKGLPIKYIPDCYISALNAAKRFAQNEQ